MTEASPRVARRLLLKRYGMIRSIKPVIEERNEGIADFKFQISDFRIRAHPRSEINLKSAI